jgi:hypothetical protein
LECRVGRGLIKDVHNVTEHVDMENITARLNDVQVTLDLLKLHGKADPNVEPRMPHDAIALLRDFGSRSFWTRPFSSELVWHDGWIQSDPPVDAASGEVVDPTLIMVAYMRAVNMWLCTLALLEPAGPPPEFALDISDVINNLESYHDELTTGIRLGPAPIPDDVVLPSPVGAGLPGKWGIFSQNIGASTSTRTSLLWCTTGRGPSLRFPGHSRRWMTSGITSPGSRCSSNWAEGHVRRRSISQRAWPTSGGCWNVCARSPGSRLNIATRTQAGHSEN